MTNRVLAFGNMSPDVYRLSEIYDPNTDTIDVVTSSGKFIPAVDSLVVDDSAGINAGKLYRVASVDPTTFETTLGTVAMSGADNTPSVLNYGNSDFSLFYDNRGTRTKLHVDSTLLLIGSNLRWYRLKSATTGIIISRPSSGTGYTVFEDLDALNTALRNTGGTPSPETIRNQVILMMTAPVGEYFTSPDALSGTTLTDYLDTDTALASGWYTYDSMVTPPIWRRISNTIGSVPIVDGYSTTLDDATYTLKQCLDCFALEDLSLSRGEKILLEIYDNTNALVVEIYLTATPCGIIQSDTSTISPITGLSVTCTNSISNTSVDGVPLWVLPYGTTKDNVQFVVTAQRSNGTTLNLSLEDGYCYVYGWESVNTARENEEFALLFKYFPPSSTQVLGTTPKSFLSFSATIKIGSDSNLVARRYSLIPYISSFSGSSTWSAAVMVYYRGTAYPRFVAAGNDQLIWIGGAFSGTAIGTKQELSFNINGLSRVEAVEVQLKSPQTYPTLLLQYNDDEVYGSNTSPAIMPRLLYNTDTSGYIFDTEILIDQAEAYAADHGLTSDDDVLATKVDYFLEYYLRSAANSVIDVLETPTHFTIRKATTGAAIITSGTTVSISGNNLKVTPLTEFMNYLTLSSAAGGGVTLDGSTPVEVVILEFWKSIVETVEGTSTTVWYPIFGVPVITEIMS